jgi:hypothetical protein
METVQCIIQQAIARTANAAQIDLCFCEVSRTFLEFSGSVWPDNLARKRLHLFR